jgi:hypothetical protein
VARPLALVSDPAAPRSVVGVIGPAFRAVNAHCQQIVARKIGLCTAAKRPCFPGLRRGGPSGSAAPPAKNLKKSLGPRGCERGFRRPSGAGAGAGLTQAWRRPVLETFSILGAVLEPQSRGVLIRDKLESSDARGAAGDFHGVRGRRSYDGAAFFRHSRNIERPSPAQLFVISAGPLVGAF